MITERVKITIDDDATSLKISGTEYRSGDIADVPLRVAARLVEIGNGELVDEPRSSTRDVATLRARLDRMK